MTKSFSSTYLWCVVLCLVFYRLIVSSLKLPLIYSAPTWILLGLFSLGYFSKFFLIPLLPDNLIDLLGFKFADLSADNELVQNSFLLTTAGFCVFCTTTVVWPKIAGNKQLNTAHFPVENQNETKNKYLYFFVLMFLCCIVTGYFQFIYKIGVMGRQFEGLPYRLGGIVFYMRTGVLPYLLTILIYVSEKAKVKKFRLAFLILLILHALSQSLLTSSRSQVLLMLLPLFFIYSFEKRINRKFFISALFILLFTVISASLFTYLRYYYIDYGYSNIINAVSSYNDQNDFNSKLIGGTLFLFGRITGFDGVLLSLTVPPPEISLSRVISLLFSEPSLSEYYTHDVAGVRNAGVGFSPGLIGGLYLLSGYPGVLVGIPLWIILWAKFWSFFTSSRYKSSLVMISYLAFFYFLQSQEGTFDAFLKMIAVLLFSFYVGEVLTNYLVKKSPGKHL